MTRALTLCSLLLLPLSACDEAAFDLVEAADRPSAIPDPPEPAEAEACELYCSEHRDACGDGFFGYGSVAECEGLCGYWARDDAKCRSEFHADIAAGAIDSLEAACADAGPDSEACGSAYVVTCDRYCDEFRTACADDTTVGKSFESPEKCRTWCEGEPLLGPEDTIECRLAALEPTLAAGPRCLAAAPDASCI